MAQFQVALSSLLHHCSTSLLCQLMRAVNLAVCCTKGRLDEGVINSALDINFFQLCSLERIDRGAGEEMRQGTGARRTTSRGYLIAVGHSRPANEFRTNLSERYGKPEDRRRDLNDRMSVN